MSGYTGYVRGRTDGRRRHPLRTTLIVVVIVIGLLVAADFAARAVAEDVLASQIKSHGFPKKPDVSIKGFPFLTQVAARDLHTVDISSTNVSAGPVTISRIFAVLHGVHIDSTFHGATVDRLDGSVFIGFPEISSALAGEAGPLGNALGGTSMTLKPVGKHEVRASVNLLITSFSATWRIASHPGNVLTARLVNSSGLPSNLLTSASNIRIPLPKLPLNLSVRKVEITPAGIVGTLSGTNLTFSG
ncbi:MAG: DUF2993 domain-containing protein [Streptosporangiaceae bacterium]